MVAPVLRRSEIGCFKVREREPSLLYFFSWSKTSHSKETVAFVLLLSASIPFSSNFWFCCVDSLLLFDLVSLD